MTGPDGEAGPSPSTCSRARARLRERRCADNMAGRPVEAARSLAAALEEIERLDGRRSATRAPRAAVQHADHPGPDATSCSRGSMRAWPASPRPRRVVDELGDDGPAGPPRLPAGQHLRPRRGPRLGLGRARGRGAAPRRVHPPRAVLGAPEPRDARLRAVAAAAGPRVLRRGRAPRAPWRGREQEFMARHNEGYAAYLLGDIPRSLAGMADAEVLVADVYRGAGPARPGAGPARGRPRQ